MSLRRRPLTRTYSYLHLKWEVCLVFYGTLEAHSSGHAHLGDQVVTARVADTRKRVVLAQEAHVQHGSGLPTATGSSAIRAPSGPERSGQFVLLLHRPCPEPREVTDQRVVRMRLRSRHLRPAPDVPAQAEQLVFTRVYAPLEGVFHMLLLLCLHFDTEPTDTLGQRRLGRTLCPASQVGGATPLLWARYPSSRRLGITSRSLAHQYLVPSW